MKIGIMMEIMIKKMKMHGMMKMKGMMKMTFIPLRKQVDGEVKLRT